MESTECYEHDIVYNPDFTGTNPHFRCKKCNKIFVRNHVIFKVSYQILENELN